VILINKEFYKVYKKHERNLSVFIPGREVKGFVSPRRTRPDLTTFFPTQTMATTGPEVMYSISYTKNNLNLK
jgi:hypothetical protein